MQNVENARPTDTPIGTTDTMVVSAPAVIADGTARFKITVKWYGLHNAGSPSSTFVQIRILRGSTLREQIVRNVTATSPGEGGAFSYIDTPPAGQHTYRLAALSLTGNSGNVMDAADSAPARITVEELPPRETAAGTLVRRGGSWTWYHGPPAVRVGSTTFLSWSEQDEIWVGGWHHDTQVLDAVRLRTSFIDDHNVGAVGVRQDGRLIVAYCDHQDDRMRLRISTNPGDATAWGPEQVIATTTGSDIITYPNLVYLSAEDRWYCFYRYRPSGSGGIRYVTSGNDGATWSAPQQLIVPVGNERPYQQWSTNGVDRIDLSVTDAHPNEATANSIYHMWYDATTSTWRNSAGASLGARPFTPNQGTRVWNGTSVKGWNWDIVTNGGNPIMVFASFPSPGGDPGLDHRYHYARWNGSTWTVNQIVPGGDRITTTEDERYYSGGLCIEPSDPSRVYLSRQILPGEWDLEEWFTPNGGTTWTRVRTIAAGGGKNVRPYAVQGSPGEIVWFGGRYDHYLDYDTDIYIGGV